VEDALGEEAEPQGGGGPDVVEHHRRRPKVLRPGPAALLPSPPAGFLTKLEAVKNSNMK